MSLTDSMKTFVSAMLAAIICLVASAPSFGRDRTDDFFVPGDSLTVSLVTCMPGPEIYELCGHEAIRVRSGAKDYIWNYGIFDFTQPNFVYRFVKGETDYFAGVEPFNSFLALYRHRGSKVVEQQLDLTQEEAWRLLRQLVVDVQPENCVYRYKYVSENCATKCLDRVEAAVAPEEVIYPDSLSYGTVRNEMRAFHKNYPWYQFGIDIALGSMIDRETTPRQEMFAPVELAHKLAGAKFADGRSLVKKETVLNEGRGDMTLPPTPFFQTPLFWSIIVLAVSIAAAVWGVVRNRPPRLVYALYWFLTGVAGLLVWFLIFISTHEATSPNILGWWLMPLTLIGAVTVWSRQCNLVTAIVAWYQMLICGFLLISWPVLRQSADPAILLLIGAGLVLGASYAIIYARTDKKHNARKRAVKKRAGAQKKRKR